MKRHRINLTTRLTASLISSLISGVLIGSAFASPIQDFSGQDYAGAAETVRSNLVEAQLEMTFDRANAQRLTLSALEAFTSKLAPSLERAQTVQVAAGFQSILASLKSGNEAQFAAARANVWTSLLGASYLRLEQSLKADNLPAARAWLSLREYRQATRFQSPDADATLALDSLGAQKTSQAEALTAVHADLLDGYQARLTSALHDLENAQASDYDTLANENASLARGYFRMLEPAFSKARSASELARAQAAFTALETAPMAATRLVAVRRVIEGFRAAPISPRERGKLASQTLRFVSLVPVEYARGATGEAGSVVVKKGIEITEAKTFLVSATNAFNDLEPLLIARNDGRDRLALTQIKTQFRSLEKTLNAAAKNDPRLPTVEVFRSDVDTLSASLSKLIPEDWRRANPAGDLDVIKQQLRQLEIAVSAKDFELAESARIGAYALLESGTEARIRVFQPQLALEIEGLFWNGVQPDGLARLISQKAPVEAFRASRKVLEVKLLEASRFVGTDASPVAAFVNALVIVFREGLEAVLILAALLGSLKAPAVRHLRRPLWLGALASFAATVVTFMIMNSILNAFAIFGEKLQAIVSVIAVAVLLVIMNWFFHNVYWNDHLANFHKKKHSLMGAKVGQGFGLALLGFTAMYREGFETVLFMQSLVLQSGLTMVLAGAAVALVLVSLIGVLVFVLQTKLPHKKMLIATGGMICVVLFVIVGNTTHILQVVGWAPIHPLPIILPYWSGMWFGTYATFEGIVLQVASVSFVIGSYFVAEGLKRRELNRKLEGNSESVQRVGKPELGKPQSAIGH